MQLSYNFFLFEKNRIMFIVYEYMNYMNGSHS